MEYRVWRGVPVVITIRVKVRETAEKSVWGNHVASIGGDFELILASPIMVNDRARPTRAASGYFIAVDTHAVAPYPSL